MRIFGFSLSLALMLGIAFQASFSQKAAAPAKPKMRALIIAVGNYPRTGGWSKLSSVQDAKILEASLRAKGFKEVTVLIDKEATKEGIEQAFGQLTKDTKAGDIVFLHFSGHGQQVWDHDSDKFPDRKKDETDGFDESLVPYDARDEFRPGVYEGENHLVDDELHLLLTELRSRIGPEGQLIFSVDACYSGSISRSGGTLPVRGTSKRFSPQSLSADTRVSIEGSAFSEAFGVTSINALSDMVVFSAARADQPNYETLDESGQGVGSLSYAISRNLMQPFSSAPSFSTFFRYIEAEMAKVAPYQSPQLEGNGDRTLFGDALTPTLGYPVLSFEDEQLLTVQGGQLAGLYPGTVVRLQRSDGSVTGEKRKGKVTASEIGRSTIELEQALSNPNPADWVMVVEAKILVFSPVQIKTALQDETILEKINTRAGEVERMSVVQEGAQLLISQAGADADLLLSDFHGKELGAYALSGGTDQAIDQLFQRIQVYTRAQYFRNFSDQASPDAGQIDILPVPVEIEQKDRRYVVKTRREDDLRSDREVQPMEIGTPFIFKVTNRSSSNLYLSLIGIDAADDVFLLLPDVRTPPAEFIIAPDTTIYFSRPEHIFQVSEPAGKQLFMAFASYQPVDLRPIFKYASSGSPGAFRSGATAQDKVLNELLFGNSRSSGLPSGQFIISSVVVDIPEEE